MTDSLFDQPAILSSDRNLLYVLTRRLGRGEGEHETVNFIMCNPSTAHEETDDPAIRRCMDFAQRWGYHRLIVTNVDPFRSPYVPALQSTVLSARERATNDRYLRAAAESSDLVVVAYGQDAPQGIVERAHGVLAGLPLHCLGVNADGTPRHPFRALGTQLPEPFPPRRVA